MDHWKVSEGPVVSGVGCSDFGDPWLTSVTFQLCLMELGSGSQRAVLIMIRGGFASEFGVKVEYSSISFFLSRAPWRQTLKCGGC